MTAAQACRRGAGVNVHCARSAAPTGTALDHRLSSAACLVRAAARRRVQGGVQDIHARRPVVKLNKKMRTALTEWQKKYGAAPWQDDMRT